VVTVAKPASERADARVRVALAPRCVDREGAAQYLGVSEDTIDRLRHTGQLPIVVLPVERHDETGLGVKGKSRRVLFDVRDLDSLIERSKETR
jgi:hypothetical protein